MPDYVLDKAVLTTEEKNKIMESLSALNEVSLTVDDDSISKLRSFLGKQYQDWIEIEFSSWGNSSEDAAIFERIKNAIKATGDYNNSAYELCGGTWTRKSK